MTIYRIVALLGVTLVLIAPWFTIGITTGGAMFFDGFWLLVCVVGFWVGG